MGAFHSGFLDGVEPFLVASSDPVTEKLLGCFEPSKKALEGEDYRPTVQVTLNGTEWRFYRHPELYLLPHTTVVITEANYDKNTDRPAPAMDEIPAPIREAVLVYEQALAQFIKLKKAVNNGG